MSSSIFVPGNEDKTPFNVDRNNKIMSDTINGYAQKNARMWQIIALVSLSSFIISLFFLGVAANQPKTVPVIVTVNDEGKTSYVGKVDKSFYNTDQIPEIAKVYQIKHLIQNMFTWVTDSSAQKLYIKQAGDICQGGAVQQLNAFYSSRNPFKYIGEQTCTVDIEEPLKQSDKTYIVYFTTHVKTTAGFEVGGAKYSMLVTMNFFNISEGNPLGIYITNFDVKEQEL